MTTINATTSIDKAQLKDDVMQAVLDAGFSEKEYNALQRQLAYRKAYNTRPSVIAKRKLYTAQRNAKMTALKSILRASL